LARAEGPIEVDSPYQQFLVGHSARTGGTLELERVALDADK